MKTTLSLSASSQLETECLVAVVLDRGEKDKPEPFVSCADKAVQQAASDLISTGDLTGKTFEISWLHKPAALKAKRLLLIGGGKAKKFTASELRKVAGAAVRALKPRSLRKLAFAVPEQIPAEQAVRAVVEGAIVGDFDPDTYKSDRKDQKIESLTVVASGDQAALQRALDEARTVSESQNFARELINEPSNRMTPTILAKHAEQMAKETGLKCEVYGADKIKELKMGAFWGVAQGSDEPPALIVLRYEPAGAPEKPVLGLVGKGITFDTGGISIKPSQGMETMKFDMGGAAAVLGAMWAISRLKPKANVIGVVPATENMPGGHAYKPGDVLRSMSGKTIEVTNTDAEGRIILSDGLAYARRLGATHLVDVATLTGSMVVALGHVNAGLLSNDDALAAMLLQAARRGGDRFARLPLDPEYDVCLASEVADVKNLAGRQGGGISAAVFLREFAGDLPWAHLDIAGTVWNDQPDMTQIPRGPSGAPTRSFVHLAFEFAKL